MRIGKIISLWFVGSTVSVLALLVYSFLTSGSHRI
jgi:hypothetical protein